MLQWNIETVKPEPDIMHEAEYGRILEKAREEYEYEPPTDYYRDGYNLQKRLNEYQDSHLYFLRHTEVDYPKRDDRLRIGSD